MKLDLQALVILDGNGDVYEVHIHEPGFDYDDTRLHLTFSRHAKDIVVEDNRSKS
jgi:hypothetical protein